MPCARLPAGTPIFTSTVIMVVDSASSISVSGNERVRSVRRPMAPSMKPPTNPEMMPRMAPSATATSVAVSAMASEEVIPSHSRDITSRPVPGSTPRGWLQLIPLNPPRGIEPALMSRTVLLLWKEYGSSTPNLTRSGAEMARTR